MKSQCVPMAQRPLRNALAGGARSLLVFNNPDSQLAALGFSRPQSASPFLPADVLTSVGLSLLENTVLFCVCGVDD